MNSIVVQVSVNDGGQVSLIINHVIHVASDMANKAGLLQGHCVGVPIRGAPPPSPSRDNIQHNIF